MNMIGFIGYGNMGSMLIRGLINSGAAQQSDIIVTRKNKDRLSEVLSDWPQLQVTEDSKDVVRKASHIFLCVKPSEAFEVLNELKEELTPDKHLISVIAALQLADMEQLIQCKISKILPTIIAEVKEGLTLVCYNSKVMDTEAEELRIMLQGFITLRPVKEEFFGFASEFTSCGPGFYAAILQEFILAGLRFCDSLTKEEVVSLVLNTVYGTAKLMLEKNMDFEAVIHRVATKGGITEIGVQVVKQGIASTFDEIFEKTMKKRYIVDENLHTQFNSSFPQK